MTNRQHLVRIGPLAACLAWLPAQTAASGFAVPEISILGLATSNALVANTVELGAIPYNPSLAAFHPGWTLSGGIILVAPSIKVTTETGKHESQGRDLIALPMFQATYQASERVTVGLGVTAPFGLETKWDADEPVFPTFQAVAQDLGLLDPSLAAIAGLHPTQSKVEIVDVAPTVAFKLGPHTALAVGADYYYVNTVEFDSVGVRNEGDGDAWGWNASLSHRANRWSFGLSYRSEASADIEGTSTFNLPAPVGPTPFSASADLTVPWRLQAGVRYEATDELAIEFDFQRTGWSSFDVLTIDNGFRPVFSLNNWDDANAYRLGVTYQWRPKTQLRFGYSFDQTPQPDRYFSARVPDNDRHLFSVGFGHDLGNGLMLEAGYMYVTFEDRDFTGSSYRDQILASLPGLDLEPNGTDAYSGNYRSHVHLLGLGLTKRFD